MKIDLGRLRTEYNDLVHAWIEPTTPRYQGGRIIDQGRLHVSRVGDGEQILQFELRDTRRLADEVGLLASKVLFADLLQYEQSPYFSSRAHRRFGRIYIGPTTTAMDEPGLVILAPTSGQEGWTIPFEHAPLHLQTFFAHEHLSDLTSLAAVTHDLSRAVVYGQHGAQLTLREHRRFMELLEHPRAIVNHSPPPAPPIFAGTLMCSLTLSHRGTC